MIVNCDLTMIGVVFTGVALVYAFLRNFKTDINAHIDRLEKQIASIEKRQTSLDERMFFLATGKTLAEAIKDEHLNQSSP